MQQYLTLVTASWNPNPYGVILNLERIPCKEVDFTIVIIILYDLIHDLFNFSPSQKSRCKLAPGHISRIFRVMVQLQSYDYPSAKGYNQG